ncbi:MAG: hypothetical protein ABI779_22530 [Acidobacteriota bacterium]
MKYTILSSMIFLAVTAVAQQRVALRDGLIIDPESNVAYVMAVGGGITAVDLGTGQARWTSDDAAKPLSIIGNVLLSQVEPKNLESRRTLAIAGLDVRKGGETSAEGAAPLPLNVQASVDETLEGRFVTDARAEDGNAVISWTFIPSARREARARPRQAARDEIVGKRKITDPPSGRLRLDLITGSMTPLSGRSDVALEQQWSLMADEIAPTNKPRYRSADGRHVLESHRIADDRTWEKYRWVISVRETGAKIGVIRSHVSFAPFVVRGSVLVFETTPYRHGGGEPQPAKLRGVSLESGQQLWAIPVREIVRRAPPPP